MLLLSFLLALRAVPTQADPAEPSAGAELSDANRDSSFFVSADKGNKGYLTKPEFLAEADRRIKDALASNPAVGAKLGGRGPNQLLRKYASMFDRLDANSDGRLTAAELGAVRR